jgi:hypothetical protein
LFPDHLAEFYTYLILLANSKNTFKGRSRSPEKFSIIGLAKTCLQHILTAAAINLERIYAWLQEIPLAKTALPT